MNALRGKRIKLHLLLSERPSSAEAMTSFYGHFDIDVNATATNNSIVCAILLIMPPQDFRTSSATLSLKSLVPRVELVRDIPRPSRCILGSLEAI